MLQHWMWSNVLWTALLVLAGGALLARSKLGVLALVLLVLFFMVNNHLFSQSELPVGSEAGDLLQIGQFGAQAQSREAICLGKAVRDRAGPGGNPRLARAATACDTAQLLAVQQCVRQPANVLVLEKEVKCQGESEPAWSKCMSAALTSQADDGTSAVATCSENRLIGLMHDVAGMFSLAKWFPPKPPVYDPACLIAAFNVYARKTPTPLPPLHCDQLLSDPARLQTCIINSLNQGLGDGGRALVSGCEVKSSGR